jgi:hypothetical protein
MKRILCLTCLVFALGCTDAEWDRTLNYGTHFKIEMYSGGKLVREWTSTGKIDSEKHSDGYYFRDKETGKLVTVSGDVVITALD